MRITGRKLTEYETDLMMKYGPCPICGSPVTPRTTVEFDGTKVTNVRIASACLWSDCDLEQHR